MKLLGREVPLGMSVTSHKPEDIKGFVENGFTCFEVGIPAHMPMEMPRPPFPKGQRPPMPSLEEGAKIACRGEEEKLVALQRPLVDAIEAEVFKLGLREIETVQLGEIVMDKIRDLDEVAYVRFASVYREFKDVNTFMDELKKLLK